MPKLRSTSFQSFDAIVDDITQLRDQGYSQGGNWNLSQVCEHLAKTMHGGLHGGIQPGPWILRATIYRLLFGIVLLTGKMPSGAKAPPEITPGDRTDDDSAKIEECLAILIEARDRQEPIPPSPFVTGMHLKKWKRLMLIHARHHLSFLKPKA